MFFKKAAKSTFTLADLKLVKIMHKKSDKANEKKKGKRKGHGKSVAPQSACQSDQQTLFDMYDDYPYNSEYYRY